MKPSVACGVSIAFGEVLRAEQLSLELDFLDAQQAVN
jgi:hypothetical protein